MSEATRTILQENSESSREAGREADGGFLWDFWYPAIKSEAIRGKKMAKATLLEVPLVLGRTNEGEVVCDA